MLRRWARGGVLAIIAALALAANANAMTGGRDAPKRATGGVVSVSPNPAVWSSTGSHTISFRNVGDANLDLDTWSGPAPASGWNLTSTTCFIGWTYAPGTGCSFTINFTGVSCTTCANTLIVFTSVGNVTVPLLESISTTVTTSTSPAVVGEPVTFTANSTVLGSAVGGVYTFSDGSTVLGTATTNGSGVTKFTTSALSAGTHTITATLGPFSYTTQGVGSVTELVEAPSVAVTSSVRHSGVRAARDAHCDHRAERRNGHGDIFLGRRESRHCFRQRRRRAPHDERDPQHERHSTHDHGVTARQP